MANLTADYGFAYVKSLFGGTPTLIECAVLTAGSDLFVGDPVKLSGTADSASRPSITVAAAADTSIFGVVQSIKATGSDGLAKQYSDSADTVMVMPTAPGAVFRVNAAGSSGPALNDIGMSGDHVAGSGDTKTGRSGYALDIGDSGGSALATSGRQWGIIGFDRRPDNVFSSTVGTDTLDVDVLVVCKESYWHTGGAGADS